MVIHEQAESRKIRVAWLIFPAAVRRGDAVPCVSSHAVNNSPLWGPSSFFTFLYILLIFVCLFNMVLKPSVEVLSSVLSTRNLWYAL